jgi:hypothetical protein
MKRAVSISIGSSKRDKAVEIELLGERVSLERIGTDGDMEKAAQRYQELDGTVDAFGVGGADLGMMIDQKWYPIHSAQKLVRYVQKTPVVDGTGLKNTLENQIAGFITRNIGDYVKEKKVFITLGIDRWGTTISFVEANYEITFGDFMFALGVPIPLHSVRQLKIVAALLVPIFTRLPFEWLYPIGEKQEERKPKWEQYYQWASVIAGDCHYVKRHMPDRLEGKVVVTNTTTSDDVAFFKKAGIKYLITSTPVLDGRSFGTNMMEAALIAVSGKGRKLTNQELNEMIAQLKLEPQLQEL